MVALRALVIASYNVRGLRDDRGAVVNVVRAMAPDLLALQEAPRRWLWRRRCAALAADCGMRIIAGYRDSGKGNLILARPTISVLATMTLRLPHRLFQQPRTAVLARCMPYAEPSQQSSVALPVAASPLDPRISSPRSITVVGTHLSTVANERGDQIERVVTAAESFASVESDDAALVVLGDFNEQPDGVVWQRLTRRFRDVGAVDHGPTFSTASPRHRIDAIFCSDRLLAHDYRVWRAAPVQAASDHFPVIAKLELRDMSAS